MQKPKLTMTSREAAALLVSGGATTDADKANLMADGKLLDPDRLERAYYRRSLGFDFECEIKEDKHEAYARDTEYNLSVKIVWTKDDNKNSQRLAKAVIKLKKLHDKHVVILDAELA